MTRAEPWYLEIGATLTEAHAVALRETFGPEVIRLGREVIARIREREPSASPQGKLFAVDALVHSYRFPRGERDAGISLGMVWYFKGFWNVISIGLDWETAVVSVRDHEWSELGVL